MRIPARPVAFAGVAIASVALLAGCAAAPSATKTASPKSKYLPCMVSDSGGFNDHSFNQLGLQGVEDAAKKLGTTYKKVQSAPKSVTKNYVASISSLIKQGCNIIVNSGFNLVDAVKQEAPLNPKVKFIVIDDDEAKLPNVKGIVFETDQAAFLGGYAAAAYSKTGVVATYGGAPYPSVTIYMDGIADGIAYYNKQKGKSVQLLGWDVPSQKGTFVGDFVSQNISQNITNGFLDKKADVIIPVAGSLYEGAAAAIKASTTSAVLEGVDADVYVSDTSGYKGLILTSILKNIEPTTATVVEQAASSGTFDTSDYIGTFTNNGVGLAPFHDYASKIPSGLPGELAKIKAGILAGSITVTSPSSFTK